jgi:hypothetical protein
MKMVSHNDLWTEAKGGETAFVKAKEMGISLVRLDFRYHQLAKVGGGWQWDDGESNRWNDLLDPSLRWTKEHGMRTLINLLAYKVPSHSVADMNRAWRSASGRGRLNERNCALWTAWAAGNGVDLDPPSPVDYTEALIDRLADGQERGDYDVAGFCILNEPNTRWPAEANWRSLEIPVGDPSRKTVTYTTADYCSDLCDRVKGHIGREHRQTLGHAVTVVNLYSYRGHWRDESWRRVAANPNLDVLGIDIYWDQMWGLYARGRPEAMRAISEEHGKDWWLVETAGADNAGWFSRWPSCKRIQEYSALSASNGAKVLGYYRLWGDYGRFWEYGKAYNIHTEPGGEPTPRADGRGIRYWETIRDI